MEDREAIADYLRVIRAERLQPSRYEVASLARHARARLHERLNRPKAA